jgi:hypothetical protein
VRFTRVTFGHHDRRVLCRDLGTLFPNVRGEIGRIAGCVTFVNAVGMRAAILYVCVCVGWLTQALDGDNRSSASATLLKLKRR